MNRELEHSVEYAEGMKQLEWEIPQGTQKMAEAMSKVAREQT